MGIILYLMETSMFLLVCDGFYCIFNIYNNKDRLTWIFQKSGIIEHSDSFDV